MSVVHRTGTFGIEEDFYDAPEAETRAAAAQPPKQQPPPGSILTGKQEHCKCRGYYRAAVATSETNTTADLKRELIYQQTKWEINELSHPTALQRFGFPFRSDAGEVAPEDSELPLLRYIFVHHVRNFPFLDQAREKEFWQDKLQKFLEIFANKHISGSDDRLEETKRRKLAGKAEKLVELMMVSGIPTASGYEERIRFAEMEVVDRGANDQGLLLNVPEGLPINGWDANIATVRTMSIKRTVRHHLHAEFIIRTKQADQPERFVGRRYGDFVKLHKVLRAEVTGKGLPRLPRKNKVHTAGFFGYGGGDGGEDSDDSASSDSTRNSTDDAFLKPGLNHMRSVSSTSVSGISTPRRSTSAVQERVVLYREEQRVTLRAFLRTCLQNERVASSAPMREFLTADPITPNQEEKNDMTRRKDMDAQRLDDQKRYYEAARKRAKELDVHMEKFRRDIVERGESSCADFFRDLHADVHLLADGLESLFREIRVKNTIAELDPGYQKFAEWLRIE